jgi:hypothetical protein
MIKLRGWTYVNSVVQFVPAWKGRRSQNIKEPKGAVDCIKCSKELHTWHLQRVWERGEWEQAIAVHYFHCFGRKKENVRDEHFFYEPTRNQSLNIFFIYIFPSLPSKQQKKVKAFNFLWFSVLTILFVPTQSVEFKVRGRPLAM